MNAAVKEYDEVEAYATTPINSATTLSHLLPTVNMPKYGHRHLANIQKETGKRECLGQR
jgi:hypothetical protein